ncbi:MULTISPECIES: hypothetical protein [Bacteria]|uniref:hypothetical protein n=1 Tax=Bacteria TaxID=2 RepID=UPI003F2BA08D
MSKESFKQTSLTGRKVLLLRDIGICDCIKKSPESKIKNELNILGLSDISNIVDEIEKADPYCDKCMGTGKKFFRILSEKIRTTDVNAIKEGTTATELQSFELLKDDNVLFYFESHYKFLNLKDHIAVLEHDENSNLIFPLKVLDVFKIVDKIEFYDNDFVYYRITGSKKKEA